MHVSSDWGFSGKIRSTLMNYVNRVGEIIRSFLAANGGMVTFFAPINEAFDRIPESVVRRMLRDRVWLEQVAIEDFLS